MSRASARLMIINDKKDSRTEAETIRCFDVEVMCSCPIRAVRR